MSALLGLATTCALLQADPFAYEGFDLDAGELDTFAGETSFGWAEPWWSFDLDAYLERHGVGEGSITYPGLTSLGNAFEFRDEGNWNVKTTYRLLPPAHWYSYGSTGQLWASVLMQPNIVGDPANGGFAQFFLSDGNTNSIMIGNGWGDTHWTGGGNRANPTETETTIPMESGVPMFAAVHLDFDAKTGAFWINPTLSATDPGTPTGTFALNTDLTINRVGMWIGNYGPSAGQSGADFTGTLVDEIRLGTTWSDVIALDGSGPDCEAFFGYLCAAEDATEASSSNGLATFFSYHGTGAPYWAFSTRYGYCWVGAAPWIWIDAHKKWLYYAGAGNGGHWFWNNEWGWFWCPVASKGYFVLVDGRWSSFKNAAQGDLVTPP